MPTQTTTPCIHLLKVASKYIKGEGRMARGKSIGLKFGDLSLIPGNHNEGRHSTHEGYSLTTQKSWPTPCGAHTQIK